MSCNSSCVLSERVNIYKPGCMLLYWIARYVFNCVHSSWRMLFSEIFIYIWIIIAWGFPLIFNSDKFLNVHTKTFLICPIFTSSKLNNTSLCALKHEVSSSDETKNEGFLPNKWQVYFACDGKNWKVDCQKMRILYYCF